MAQQVTNPTNIHEHVGWIPGLDQWVRDPVLLWLWCRLAAAALIQPQAWKLPYAAGVALKSKMIITIINFKNEMDFGSSCHGLAVTNLTRIH